MANTPENRAKEKTKRLIAKVCSERGLKYRIDWNAGSAFMSTLDAVGVIAGHPFVAEVKRFDENEEPTSRQCMHIEAFRMAGAFVHILNDETALAYLNEWLSTLEPRDPHAP